MALMLILLIGSYLTLLVLLREATRFRWIKELRQLAVKERNRNRFGELRTSLLSLAREGKVNPHSKTFRVLYSSLTILMREPHDYAEAADALLSLSPPSSFEGDPIPLEEATLFIKFAEALDQLCRDFSLWYRCLAKIFDRQLAGKERGLPLFIRMSIARSRDARKLQTLRRARAQLESVGQMALKAA